MGSKTPSIKEKKETCEVCNTKFVNLAGLVSHQSARHPELKNRDSSIANKSISNSTSRISKRIQIKKGSDVDTEEIAKSTDKPSAGKPTTKTEFKCPKCNKIFPINFQAVKHIEKKHSEDDEGNSVSSDTSDLIKPIPVEKCTSCSKYFDADISHKCSTSGETHANAFYCLGCDHRFMNLIAFHKHVVHVHHEKMDNMFFKTAEEFEMWKKTVETIVKMKYLTLNKGVAYKYYSCNYVSTKNTFNTTYLCPSLIMAKTMESGIQIHYNKVHFEHSCPKYVVPEEFTKYLTNKAKVSNSFDALIKKKELEEETQQSLYKKYQNLMENIKIDAERVGVPLLKKLFNLALKMQGIINSHDEEEHNVVEDIPIINKSMTDDQITNMLESKRTSARLKRKSETRSSDDGKKPKVDEKVVLKENKEYESPKIKPKLSTTMSPSFNDSYKQFLGTAEPKDKLKSKVIKRKEVVKTKIGQFSPKKKSSSFDETIEKTRSSPNILKPSITNKIVKEIKYEVREQENDCNILILKI